jgi:putative ATP-dependent DNA ligase
MDRDWVVTLGMDEKSPADVLGQFERSEFRGRPYRHLSNARYGIERGTVVVPDGDGDDPSRTGDVVRGFPSIPRALVLEPAVADHFDGPVTIEEKLNGYNVRVASPSGLSTDGGPLAFTRSGYVCPYTTNKVREALDPGSFFEANPDRMLCGELVGPENPYTAHHYQEVDSADFFVFDVRDRLTGEPVSVERRRDLCEEYGFSQVPDFGTHDPDDVVEAAFDAIDDLDERGREGVILKSADGTTQVKYTTSHTHRDDLAYAFSLPFDYGRDFVYARIVREAFQAVEFEEDEETVRERARKLGESILLPAVETIRDVQAGDEVGEVHTVRDAPDAVEELLVHLENMGITMHVLDDHREGPERVVTFRKIAEATRDNTQNYLDGQLLDE